MLIHQANGPLETSKCIEGGVGLSGGPFALISSDPLLEVQEKIALLFKDENQLFMLKIEHKKKELQKPS